MCIKYCLTISENVQSSEIIYKYTDIFRTNNDYFRTNRQYSVSPPLLIYNISQSGRIVFHLLEVNTDGIYAEREHNHYSQEPNTFLTASR